MGCFCSYGSTYLQPGEDGGASVAELQLPEFSYGVLMASCLIQHSVMGKKMSLMERKKLSILKRISDAEVSDEANELRSFSVGKSACSWWEGNEV